MMENLLVVGFNARPVATQAKMCGFRVFVVDYWGDIDIYRWVDDILVVKHYSDSEFDFAKVATYLAEIMAQRYRIDGVLVGSGLDDRWDCLERIQGLAPIIGNSPDKVRSARRKVELYMELKRKGIIVPETVVVENSEEAVSAAREIGFPVIVRREAGGGGLGVHLARKREDVALLFDRLKGSGKVLIQEYVRGEDASASVLCNGKKSVTLTVNRQLIGVPWLGGRDFVYCGNLVPHEDEEVCKTVKRVAEKICELLGLVGSNGVDFVLREGTPVFMEVNPRFQGTIECVSMVTGMNIVKKHIEACMGSLPNKVNVDGFAIKGVIFSKKRTVVPNLDGIPFLYDITKPGEVVEAGTPICSIQLKATTPDECMEKLKKTAETIYSRFR